MKKLHTASLGWDRFEGMMRVLFAKASQVLGGVRVGKIGMLVTLSGIGMNMANRSVILVSPRAGGS